ncbi:MAG: type II toxin-antitoxin system RelE/ParE family toxin [Spirochaetales bacterium]|nr:type II toxin-antitoxin system RelE/ParE family toxin [Spirochaetales bacterium]
MKRYRVIVSGQAAAMLVSYSRFLARVSKAAADRLVSEFEAAAGSLEQQPGRFPWLEGPCIPTGKYKKCLFAKPYLLLYQIKEKNVFIDYVVDCRQDYAWLIT